MIDEGLLRAIGEYIPQAQVQEIVDKIDNANNTSKVAPLLTELQDINNKLYRDYGLTDTILDFQCYINGLRNLYDIPDETEQEESEYVQ